MQTYPMNKNKHYEITNNEIKLSLKETNTKLYIRKK